MINSAIQQGSVNSSQSVNYETVMNELSEFLSVLREKLPELVLSSEQNSELDADIITIQAQIDSNRPKYGIIKESLLSIQRIIEGATGAIVAQQLLSHMPVLFALL